MTRQRSNELTGLKLAIHWRRSDAAEIGARDVAVLKDSFTDRPAPFDALIDCFRKNTSHALRVSSTDGAGSVEDLWNLGEGELHAGDLG